ncbi:MAG: SCP2 sterol-binding domain-containing protein, partial [Actinomycetota bacterium]|nr:SCP2 sterol-binding domain-containing protein [Actinomycetota bacterium]
MAVFKDADQVYELIGGLFERLRGNKEIAEKFASSGLVIRFVYSDPDCEIWLDASTKDPNDVKIVKGPAEGITAEVEMSMKAEVAHQFWLGNLNLMVALTRKQIVAKGPIRKIMQLLPVLKPAYEIYRNMLHERGLDELISSK